MFHSLCAGVNNTVDLLMLYPLSVLYVWIYGKAEAAGGTQSKAATLVMVVTGSHSELVPFW